MTDTVPSIREELDPVLLEFGATVLICQLFESSLCRLLALIAESRNPSDFAAYDASWDFHSEKTLGGLLQALKAQVEVPSELETYLREGIDKRNLVIHGFLPRNVQRMAEPQGRIKVLQELQQMKKDIRRRDLVIVKLIDTLLAKYGLSTNVLKEQFDRQWAHLNRVAGDPGSVGG